MPDIVTSKTFVDGEKGITAAKLNQIISGSVIQPAFYSAKPSSATLDPTDVLLELKGTGAYAQITGTQLASSVAGQLPLADATQNGMLRQVSGNTTDVVDGTNHCVPIASMPGITQMRLRSFNSIGNPTFEVDQRTVGVGISAPTTVTFAQDRWGFFKAGGTTMAASANRSAVGQVILPGTNFAVSANYLRTTLTAAQATLGASDALWVNQSIEGPVLRELIGDVHSVSLLVRSSVAGLTFGLALRDSTGTRSLTKLCTIPSANTWTLIQLPNLPVWAAGGSFPLSPGGIGYSLLITLAAGTTLTAPANDTWQNGNFTGALGQANFAAQAVNSTFDIAFVQHEPGAFCTTLIDKPFMQNLDECLRYFCKSYAYAQALGSATAQACLNFTVFAGGFATLPSGYASFPKELAKSPTMTIYASGGAINNVLDGVAATNRVVNSTTSTTRYLSQITLATASVAGNIIQFHYTADTGW
jgi:hypothetical protein